MSDSKTARPTVVYDGECPFCSNYVKFVRLKDSLGPVRLVDARSLSREEIAALGGYDLDEGMLLIIDGRTYHGADAVNAIALMSSGQGWFNRLNAAIFRSALLSKVLYPVLRLGRAVALKFKGVGWIDETVSKR